MSVKKKREGGTNTQSGQSKLAMEIVVGPIMEHLLRHKYDEKKGGGGGERRDWESERENIRQSAGQSKLAMETFVASL